MPRVRFVKWIEPKKKKTNLENLNIFPINWCEFVLNKKKKNIYTHRKKETIYIAYIYI